MKLKRIKRGNYAIKLNEKTTYNIEFYFKKTRAEEDIENIVKKSLDVLALKILPKVQEEKKHIFTTLYYRTLKGKKITLHVYIYNDKVIQILEPTWINKLFKKW